MRSVRKDDTAFREELGKAEFELDLLALFLLSNAPRWLSEPVDIDGTEAATLPFGSVRAHDMFVVDHTPPTPHLPELQKRDPVPLPTQDVGHVTEGKAIPELIRRAAVIHIRPAFLDEFQELIPVVPALNRIDVQVEHVLERQRSCASGRCPDLEFSW